MAISETTLKATILMMVDDINKKAGCSQEGRGGGRRPGFQLAAVRREGARSDRQGEGRRGVRLLDLGVAQSVLPVFEELNGLLFYPVQYEGEESSRNVFYTGAAPNQQAIPAVQ